MPAQLGGRNGPSSVVSPKELALTAHRRLQSLHPPTLIRLFLELLPEVSFHQGISNLFQQQGYIHFNPLSELGHEGSANLGLAGHVSIVCFNRCMRSLHVSVMKCVLQPTWKRIVQDSFRPALPEASLAVSTVRLKGEQYTWSCSASTAGLRSLAPGPAAASSCSRSLSLRASETHCQQGNSNGSLDAVMHGAWWRLGDDILPCQLGLSPPRSSESPLRLDAIFLRMDGILMTAHSSSSASSAA